LYQKGDFSHQFYFLLSGKIELMVESHNEGFKFSKNVDEFEFFGLKSMATEPRNDYAKVVTEKCWVLHIDKENYEQIVKRT
jgi:CRP-like cAMP-binding protein